MPTLASLKETIDEKDHQVTYDGLTELITSPSSALAERQKNSSTVNNILPNIVHRDTKDIAEKDIPQKVIKTSR